MLPDQLDGLVDAVLLALLLSLRIAALLLVTPLLQTARVPNSAKVALVLGLSLAISQSLGVAPI